MRNVSVKLCRDKQYIKYMFKNVFQNCVFFDIFWKSVLNPERPHMIQRHMRITCWIPKATNIHSQYVILIAFRLPKKFHANNSMLRYMYIV